MKGQVSTVSHKSLVTSEKNWVDSYSYGMTAYQIDRSASTYSVYYNGVYYTAYYYYIYFYNKSKVKSGNYWMRTSTYIQNININIDGVDMGNQWMLITSDYWHISYWSLNPRANVIVTHSNPVPY